MRGYFEFRDYDSLRGLEKWFTSLGVSRDGTDYLIQAPTRTDRWDLVKRDACKWVAAYLPGRKKRLHELRKQCATDVSKRAGHPIAGAMFIGDSLQTAVNHYVDQSGMYNLDPL